MMARHGRTEQNQKIMFVTSGYFELEKFDSQHTSNVILQDCSGRMIGIISK